MSSFIGREAVVNWNGADVAGVRTKGMTVNNTVIDITNDDDTGVRKLLADPGEKQVDITVSGVLADLVLLKASISGTTQATVTFTFPPAADGSTVTGAVISGTFNMASFAQTGEYNGAPTFDATFNSSGVVTFTDGANV